MELAAEGRARSSLVGGARNYFLFLSARTRHHHLPTPRAGRGEQPAAERAESMSARKRMSLGGLRGRASPTASESGLGESENKSVRRSSIGLRWAAGIGGALKTSVQRASAAADRFERRLFAEYDDDPVDFSGDGDAYGMLCAQRGQGQRAEFESRCVGKRLTSPRTRGTCVSGETSWDDALLGAMGAYHSVSGTFQG